jgi:cytochrome P450
MKSLEPRIAEIVTDHLDAMEAAGPPVDLVKAFALPVPALVISELLGVPEDDRGHFQEQTAACVDLGNSQEQAMAAFGQLARYFGELVQRKRNAPEDDLVSGLTKDGDLTDEEITNMVQLLHAAGHETTANMLGIGVFALLRHPAQLARLRRDPSLADNAVEELMRYLTIIHVGAPYRAALEDVELGGRLIRAGDTVTLGLPAINRDPARYPGDPEQLRLDREEARHHLGYGHGVHQCIGQRLAHAEMRTCFPALFDRFPTLRLAVPAEEIPLRESAMTYGVNSLPVTWDT